MYIPRKTSPLELLLLGALQYLGRGFTFDDIEEDTFISADVHRCFFHSFTKWGADVLYNTYVWMPDSVSEVTECEEAYRIAGLPGCIGSSDATHVPLKKVRYSFRHAHLGFKSKATTRTYNIVVNHKRRILSSSSGHPGRWNDKTIVKFDPFLERLQNGEYDDMLQFELLNNESSSGNEGFKGAYVIVDNGYLDWSTTVPPIKNSCVRDEINFSQWLESLRKDVECTFGILKGRWSILSDGIRLHSTHTADNVWLTCCALHNMLLEVDGLNKEWNTGILSDWEKESIECSDLPFAGLSAINTTSNAVSINTTSNAVSESSGLRSPDSCVSVTDTSLSQFCSKLIKNFNILNDSGKVIWPSRLQQFQTPRQLP
jgi:hypothetical protein